jgi:hypothetical protein
MHLVAHDRARQAYPRVPSSGRDGKLPPQEAIRARRGRWRARRSRMTAAATSAIG